MFEFILTIVLFSSVGVMLLILARALPRVEEEPSAREPMLDRLLSSGIPERLDAAMNSILEKFLRKARVALLKADNSIAAVLKKVKPNGNGNGKPPVDFVEIISSEKNNGSGSDSAAAGK